ncbi:MAG: NADPH-dependent reductase [Candidatus Saccharibacteria bacterium]|nr:NADPH-dependent reductase [Candidatus Saccharibacteria bacterium]
MALVKIILGSTRPNRFGAQPAEWVMEQTKHVSGHQFELIDLEKVNLPLLDEPTPPMMRQYSKDHTKVWSQMIDEADGFIFITAEYNHSVPAALKNAIDFLFHEWNYKPASFVSYGSLAGGARAVEHLRGICGEVKIYDLREQMLMPDYYHKLDEQGLHKFEESHHKEIQNILEQTVFWADRMKAIRQELQDQPT